MQYWKMKLELCTLSAKTLYKLQVKHSLVMCTATLIKKMIYRNKIKSLLIIYLHKKTKQEINFGKTNMSWSNKFWNILWSYLTIVSFTSLEFQRHYCFIWLIIARSDFYTDWSINYSLHAICWGFCHLFNVYHLKVKTHRILTNHRCVW